MEEPEAHVRRGEEARGAEGRVHRGAEQWRGKARQGAAGRGRGVATCGRARRGAARCGRARTDDVAVAEQWLGRLEEDVVEVGEEHLLGVVKGLPGF